MVVVLVYFTNSQPVRLSSFAPIPPSDKGLPALVCPAEDGENGARQGGSDMPERPLTRFLWADALLLLSALLLVAVLASEAH